MLSGIAASPGIVMGEIYLLNSEQENSTLAKVLSGPDNCANSEDQVKLFHSAINESRLEINDIREKAFEKMGEEHAAIFDAHLLLLADPEIESQVLAEINGKKKFAVHSLKEVTDQFITLFESMDDEYMSERAVDIRDVFTRVLNHLVGVKAKDLSSIDRDVILATHDLTPSQTAIMDKEHVKGFLTDIGGRTSHSAIMARMLEIPAIVGLVDISKKVQDGDFIIFDGSTGEVYLNPNDELIKEFKSKKEEQFHEGQELLKLSGLETITLDGHKVETAGNIGSFDDLSSFEKNDAEAVGLYRTEFLFMDRSEMPSEQEQFEAYSKIVERLSGKKCIIRTLDIGGDKKLDYLKVGKEENPFLGYRAIRICLKEVEIFKAQLRALLRVSVIGPIGIMFPMISSLEELLQAKGVLEECKAELKREGVDFSSTIDVGMMIEIPSAAMMTDILADHVDFFSIGTNDLTQYTCAVDRMNEKIEKLYEPFHPGLLRLIEMTIRNAKNKCIMPAMCGSMAHIRELVPLFVGMGLYEFSMSPLHILPTRKLIRSLNYEECKALVPKIMKLGSASEVKKELIEFLRIRDC